MKTADPPDAWGYTIFCDDIRVEVGGKLTYVGSYGGRMGVYGTFPCVLPKIFLGIVYYQHLGKVELPIKFWVFLPGDADEKPSIVAEWPREAVEQSIREAEALSAKIGTEATFVTTYSQFSLAGLNLPQPGLMRVRAIRGDQLIRLGTLEIIQAPSGEQPLPMPPQP